jgi:hypothetical protein
MFRRHFITLLLAASALATTACSASYDVVRRAEPGALTCSSELVVLPVAYENVIVGKKSEADYLFTKSQETKESWQADKQAIDREFRRSLVKDASDGGLHIDAAGATSGRFTILPKVLFLEPGFFAGPARKSSKVLMMVEIATPDGEVIEEIELESGTMGSLMNATIRSRFEKDGQELGEAMAEYLQGRVTACAEGTRRSM